MLNATKFSTLHILPGPIYDAPNVFGLKYRELSQFSSGTVVSTSNKDNTYVFNKYKAILLGVDTKNKILQNLRLLLKVILEARALSSAKRIDLIVCYDPLKTGLIGLLVKWIFRTKLIVEINGIYNSPVLYQSGSKYSTLKRHIYKLIQQFVVNHADGIKSLFKTQLSDVTIPKNTKCSVYFDFTHMEAATFNSQSQNTILSIGFPMYIKGLDLLIRSFNRIYDDFKNWKLVIVGHFSNEEVDTMQELIGNNSNLYLKKPILHSEIDKVIDSCDIFVLASRTEAMGRVLLEAMARCKPRLGSNVGGIPTVINDGIDGILFESENIDDLTSKLRQLMECKENRYLYASNALKRYKDEFSVDRYRELTYTFYSKVVDL